MRVPTVGDAVLHVTDLRRSYEQGGHTIHVLRGVNLSVAPGEIVALLGPSGSGKSTMLQAIGLLEGGFEGSIRIAGEEAARLDNDGRTRVRRDRLGFVYQFHHLLPDFSAQENVVLPLMIHGATRAEADERSRTLLSTLGLSHRLDHRPSKLSGGEQQRVAIARALAPHPALLFADEPTGNLDAANGAAIMDLLFERHADTGATLFVITHDVGLAERCQRIVELRDGLIVADRRAA